MSAPRFFTAGGRTVTAGNRWSIMAVVTPHWPYWFSTRRRETRTRWSGWRECWRALLTATGCGYSTIGGRHAALKRTYSSGCRTRWSRRTRLELLFYFLKLNVLNLCFCTALAENSVLRLHSMCQRLLLLFRSSSFTANVPSRWFRRKSSRGPRWRKSLTMETFNEICICPAVMMGEWSERFSTMCFTPPTRYCLAPTRELYGFPSAFQSAVRDQNFSSLVLKNLKIERFV